MIDFGCKRFDIDEIIKCGLGLTKTEFRIFRHFIRYIHKDCTTKVLSDRLDLNLTTIQKACKKLSEREVIFKHQQNLAGGGYLFTYTSAPKDQIRKVLKSIIRRWSKKFDEKIDKW